MTRDDVPKFFCAECGRRTGSRVLDSIPDQEQPGRDASGTGSIHRRRQCLDCGGTFATKETLAPQRRRPRRRPKVSA